MEANIERSWGQRVAKVLEESIMKLCLPKTEKKKPSPSPEEEESSSMVGLSDQFIQIIDHLLTDDAEGSESHEFAVITGMVGIGKTRLAQKIFHDPSIRASFDCRLFVRTGRGGGYAVYEDDKMVLQGDYEDLDWEAVTRDRKCFILLDDMREVKICDINCLVLDEVRGEFSSMDQLSRWIDNSMGNRMLVTSRKEEYESTFKMRFLNEEESWELLRRKVFGEDQEEEDCPRELVKAGKKIAKECEGLPLLIIKVAPILISIAQKNPEAWKRVAEKPDSVLEEASLQISEVLLSNYHQLENENLKLCFLYIAAFPKKYLVWATTIAYLWYAEGFIYSWNTLISSAEMVSLHENNLVMGHHKGYWNNSLYKACSLHCAYWYVCRREADNKKILYTIKSLADGLDERIKGHRRLAIYTSVLFAIKEVHDSMASIATVRSLLCTGPYNPYQVPMCWDWKLLRVLSALTIRFYEFPVEVVKLICLKFLSLTCNANLPPSISQLWNLQFLIVHQHSSIKRVGVVTYLPVEIWDLQELELLQIMGRNLPDPPRPGVVLPKLRKVLDVGVKSCTKGVLESLPKLKKLRVQIELAPQSHVAETITMICFDHFSCLDQLYSFQCVVMNPTISHPPPPLSFYMENLVSLCLSGCGYPWEDISMIAELPSLYKLKLKSYAFRGEKWEGEGMRFRKLESLFIEDTDLMQWTAGRRTFPYVWRLMLKNCHKLQNIPLFSSRACDGYAIEIKLVDCNPSVETFTKKMYRTYERVTVTATYSWKKEKTQTLGPVVLETDCLVLVQAVRNPHHNAFGI